MEGFPAQIWEQVAGLRQQTARLTDRIHTEVLAGTPGLCQVQSLADTPKLSRFFSVYPQVCCLTGAAHSIQ